jgi:hypothetical protein
MNHEALQFMTTWVVVADGRHGRIYGYVAKNHPWKLIIELAPGIDRGVSETSRLLIAALESGRARHSFDRLLLVAPPTTLGALRHDLTAALNRCVALTVPKSYAHASAAELHDALLDQLPLD